MTDELLEFARSMNQEMPRAYYTVGFDANVVGTLNAEGDLCVRAEFISRGISPRFAFKLKWQPPLPGRGWKIWHRKHSTPKASPT
jgi:hypothetical protein